jgi:hypothetical protein
MSCFSVVLGDEAGTFLHSPAPVSFCTHGGDDAPAAPGHRRREAQDAPPAREARPRTAASRPAESRHSPSWGQQYAGRLSDSPAGLRHSPSQGQYSPSRGDTAPREGRYSLAGGRPSPLEGETSPAWGAVLPARGNVPSVRGECCNRRVPCLISSVVRQFRWGTHSWPGRSVAIPHAAGRLGRGQADSA